MEDDDNELLLDTPLDEGDDTPSDMDGGDGDEINIEIEGEEPADEPDLVKHLRTVARDAQRELAEARKAQAPAPVDPGPKPTLDDCEWDPEKYETALLAWNEATRKAQQSQQAQSQAAQSQTDAFNRANISYRAKASAIGIKNIEAVETKVADALGKDYLGFIVQYADNPATLVAALGAHPGLLAKVADEPDPMRRLIMLTKMEAKVKVTRKGPPPPEAATIQRGSASLSAPAADKQAEKLLSAAMKPGGTMTEYNRYMKAKKAK